MASGRQPSCSLISILILTEWARACCRAIRCGKINRHRLISPCFSTTAVCGVIESALYWPFGAGDFLIDRNSMMQRVTCVDLFNKCTGIDMSAFGLPWPFGEGCARHLKAGKQFVTDGVRPRGAVAALAGPAYVLRWAMKNPRRVIPPKIMTNAAVKMRYATVVFFLACFARFSFIRLCDE